MSSWQAYPDCYNCGKTVPCPCFTVISFSTDVPDSSTEKVKPLKDGVDVNEQCVPLDKVKLFYQRLMPDLSGRTQKIYNEIFGNGCA